MDPNACFQLILDALETHDTDEARDHADDLRNWLRRGGFMPAIQPHELEFLLTALPSMRGTPMKRTPAKLKPDRLLLLTDRLDRLADQLADLAGRLDPLDRDQ